MSNRDSLGFGELLPQDVVDIFAQEKHSKRGRKKRSHSLGRALVWLKGKKNKDPGFKGHSLGLGPALDLALDGHPTAGHQGGHKGGHKSGRQAHHQGNNHGQLASKLTLAEEKYLPQRVEAIIGAAFKPLTRHFLGLKKELSDSQNASRGGLFQEQDTLQMQHTCQEN
ncbi:hypothetical protein NQZ68_023848 [Dissostichus eleginoides]|nr:hypothetical protein NQZ68_023848 [Dissostichus eleginoides]